MSAKQNVYQLDLNGTLEHIEVLYRTLLKRAMAIPAGPERDGLAELAEGLQELHNKQKAK